jgi:AraC-like DNA-binding protein
METMLQSALNPAFFERTSTPPEPSVSHILIAAIGRALERRGIDASLLCGDPRPPRLAFSELQELFARAIELSGDASLALQIVSDASEASFGLLAHLILYAPTLRAALEICSRFHPLMIDDGCMFLSERGDTARLRCEFLRGTSFDATFAEFILSGLMRMLREFGAMPDQVSAVYFEHARPSHHAAYTRVFGDQVRFEQALTGLDFARALLDRPSRLHQAELFHMFESEAQRSLELLPQPRSLVQQLEKYLAVHPVGRMPALPQAARDLNTSERSLRRQLSREGLSYREVTQAALQRGAVRLLRDPNRTLQEVAHTLGFADASSFNRAFKRWTGLAPGQYRADLRQRAKE